jgi:hypothetical protein
VIGDARRLQFSLGYWESKLITYTCRNCLENTKLIAVSFRVPTQGGLIEVIKIGEIPAFGSVTSPRLLGLIGPDRDNFLRGRRCESQGLGVGAFAYYRRVIENQAGRIVVQLRAVVDRVGGDDRTREALEKAAKETAFSRIADLLKEALPSYLLVAGGHNPLFLIHRAMSMGLHSKSDEECLDLAQTIRVVLAHLAERVGEALRDDAELTAAVGRLSRIVGED